MLGPPEESAVAVGQTDAGNVRREDGIDLVGLEPGGVDEDDVADGRPVDSLNGDGIGSREDDDRLDRRSGREGARESGVVAVKLEVGGVKDKTQREDRGLSRELTSMTNNMKFDRERKRRSMGDKRENTIRAEPLMTAMTGRTENTRRSGFERGKRGKSESRQIERFKHIFLLAKHERITAVFGQQDLAVDSCRHSV